MSKAKHEKFDVEISCLTPLSRSDSENVDAKSTHLMSYVPFIECCQNIVICNNPTVVGSSCGVNEFAGRMHYLYYLRWSWPCAKRMYYFDVMMPHGDTLISIRVGIYCLNLWLTVTSNEISWLIVIEDDTNCTTAWWRPKWGRGWLPRVILDNHRLWNDIDTNTWREIGHVLHSRGRMIINLIGWARTLFACYYCGLSGQMIY